ncbi:MAG: prepilin-type N-terminal cleavage/methylation domain-containing protein [Bradyrhizobiaceae bacterium]|nr:prepilin-type N-terminal cleavage/methylation domain-containing protein [Bradyrhizobiaceae bacterium]
MRKYKGKTRYDDLGFTLIEMLVAIVLMGIVLTALGVITAQWLPNWSRGFNRVQGGERVSIALDRIVSDLGAAEFLISNGDNKLPLFSGDERGVTFVRSAYGPNTRRGLEIVRIAETADREGLLLARSTTPFTLAGVMNFANPVVLLRAPYRVSFSYAGGDGAWKNSWQNQPELPATVRLTVHAAATERALAVSTAAIVHVDLPAECVRPRNKPECRALAAQDSAADTAAGIDRVMKAHGLAPDQ